LNITLGFNATRSQRSGIFHPKIFIATIFGSWLQFILIFPEFPNIFGQTISTCIRKIQKKRLALGFGAAREQKTGISISKK
jgi:hypothetical protein